MAVCTSDNDVFTESVRALYCSFILVSAPSRFALSSGLRLSALSASSSSTDRIASEMPSRLVWRSFSTSCKQRERVGKSADQNVKLMLFNQYFFSVIVAVTRKLKFAASSSFFYNAVHQYVMFLGKCIKKLKNSYL